MSDISTYAAVLDVGAGRTLSGVLAPFNGEVHRGCFARTIAERGASGRIKLVADMPKGRPLVVATASQLVETDRGLHAVFDVADGPAGDVVLERDAVPCTVRLRQLGEHEFKLVDVRLGGLQEQDDAATRHAAGPPPAPQPGISVDVARRRLALWDLEAGR